MKYRAVYQPKLGKPNSLEVVSSYENDSNIITTTGQTFLVDEIDSLIWKLASTGVDFALMWRKDFTPRITPLRQEEVISPHPDDATIERRVSVYGTNADYNNERFRYSTLVRHFDAEGNHLVDVENGIDDVFVSRIVDNSQTVDDGQGNQIGEYDYFSLAIDAKVYSIAELEQMRIAVMDANGIYNDIY